MDNIVGDNELCFYGPINGTTPVLDTPWSELQHYPIIDPDDTETPWADGINHNTMLEEGLETRVQEDKRIETIRLDNVNFGDAILAGALSSKKQRQQQEEEYAT